ncbi:RNA polymerase sigma factor [Patiriisocius sp. Uisw_047]|uniref:RNA polymerase sigma factor n=1 Tax=Patiriisocius sp. Uisw_047 TaxID=3230969 RepID=UPI0039EC1540
MSLTTTDISILVSLCKKENQLAQLEIYNRYNKAMYTIAARIVKNTAEAEDVMQESFIAAFDKIDSFNGTATFGAWLKRIVVNNSIAQYKKSLRFVSVDDDEGITIEDEATEVSYEGISEADYKNVEAAQLMIALDQINEKYRQVITLHYMEGYDHKEISEIMQVSYGNARTLLSRAKDSLRFKIDQL